MATAGILVLQGHADGSFNAYDSETGKRLWTFAAGSGVLGPPITYKVNGRQYITVLSGFGTSGALFGEKVARFGWQYRTQPRRILTFVHDGKAWPLPAAEPDHPEPVADHEYRPAPALEEEGEPISDRPCQSRDGVGLKAAALAPATRPSPDAPADT